MTTHLLENCYDIRTIQELLGHWNLQTTMIYTYVNTKNILGVKNPLDRQSRASSVDELFTIGAKLSKELGLAKPGDLIVITGGIPVGVAGSKVTE